MTSRLPIALDAMGGDHAPAAIIEGAKRAIAEHGLSVVVVGRTEELGDTGDLPVIHASEVISMDDDPGAGVRRKKDSSLVRCAELVRDGKASAMVSAGNTGAAMASALLRMGRIRGVSRPAIAAPVPVPGHTPTILLDAGANVDCQPDWLVQFALMGSTYAGHRFGIASPRVAVLSIGEEPGKGNALAKATYELLAARTDLNFIGNVEGRDVMTDDVDVVVTDGFTGNVVLKSLEGALKTIVGALLGAFAADPSVKDHADALLPSLLPVYESLHPDRVGGAMLLGVNGVCIISHGSSSPGAIVNALRVANDMAVSDVVEAMRVAVGSDEHDS